MNELNSEIAKRLIKDSEARKFEAIRQRDEMERRVGNALRGVVPNDVGIMCIEAVRDMYQPRIKNEDAMQATLRTVYLV